MEKEEERQHAIPYEECPPEQFYGRLEESLAEGLSERQRMLIIGEVFRQSIDQYVSHASLTFTGLYTKLISHQNSYLIPIHDSTSNFTIISSILPPGGSMGRTNSSLSMRQSIT